MSDPVLELTFQAGIDESMQDELVEAGKGFPELANVRQDRFGALSKRLAFTSQSAARIDGTSRTAGRRLLMNREQLCTIDGTHLDVYSTSAAGSAKRNRVPACTYRLREAPTLGRSAYAFDVVCANGYVVLTQLVRLAFPGYIWQGFTVLDEATGAVVSGPVLLDFTLNLTDVRLAKYGNYVFAFTPDLDAGEIRIRYIDLTSPTTISAGWTSLTTLTDYNTGFDCANLIAGDRVAIAYGSTGNASNRIVVKTYNIGGVVDSVNITPGTALGADDANGVALAEDADTLWLAYFNNLTPAVVGLNPTNISGTPLASTYSLPALGGSEAPSAIYVCARTGNGKCQVFVQSYDSTASATCYPFRVQALQTTAGATATDGPLGTLGGVYMASRPFLYGGRIYAFSEGVLCDCTFDTDAYALPTAAPLQRGISVPSPHCRASVVTSDSTRLITAIAQLEASTVFALRLVELDFADPQRWRAAELNGSTYLGGGVVTQFDGSRAFESGFLSVPVKPQVNTAFAGSQSFTNGRVYVCTYEHMDADGNRHISGVSLPSDNTGVVVTQTVTVRTTPLALTSRAETTSGNAVIIGIWATLDSANGQPPYYRVGETASDPLSTLVQVDDTISDADLATQPLLYGTGSLPGTNGSSQDHRAPPGLTHIVAYNGMLVGASGRTVFYSSQFIDGEGQWWSPVFTVPIDDEVTGFEVMDGSIYAFTRSRIFVSAGDPPSDNGTSGGLSSWRKLATAGGCINGNSIIGTPQGIFFQSARGIERLTRGGTVEWIGQPIMSTLATYPYVSSAVYDDVQGFVRISCAESESAGAISGTGRTLIYDTSINVWQSVDAYTSEEAAQDAAMVYWAGQWRYAWLGAGGVVHTENLTTDAAPWVEDGFWVQSRVVLPWVHIAGLQGEQFIDRVLLLARYHTKHQLRISLAFDYESGYTSVKTFTNAQLAALAKQWLDREMGDHTTSQAVRVKLEDTFAEDEDAATGQGATWCAITFSGQPHRGQKRTSGAQRGAAA